MATLGAAIMIFMAGFASAMAVFSKAIIKSINESEDKKA